MLETYLEEDQKLEETNGESGSSFQNITKLVFRPFQFKSIKFDFDDFHYRTLFSSTHYTSNEFLKKFLKLKKKNVTFLNPAEYNTKFRDMKFEAVKEVSDKVKDLKVFCKSKQDFEYQNCKSEI